jgi:molybdopterin molybdotransferase
MTNAAPTSPALSYADALTAVLRDVVALPAERIPLESSLGRALADDVSSPIALPSWDNAGMDGYAVQRTDVMGARAEHPVTLIVVGSIAAGADPATLPAVAAGVAARIMTGAPMPSGADAVVRIEDTDRGTERVTIMSDRDLAGRGNVRPLGEDVAAGTVVFTRGTTIGASHLGALASVGCATPTVHRQPRVTVLASGDELVLLDRFADVQAGRRIVSSTSYALPALLRQAGADVNLLPLLPDDLPTIRNAIQAAVEDGCDLLVTTGGVSVGAHDYTREALAALGGTLGFWRARIRPGGPIGLGTVLGIPWLGLPGNPVSTMVTGALFAWPLVRRLGGHARVHHAPLQVRMLDAVDTPATLSYFVRVRVTVGGDGQLDAHLAGPQGSNLLRTMAVANALLVVPESVARVEAGMTLSALLLPGAELLSDTPALLAGEALQHQIQSP